ncbi:MAG: hypothetical protein AAGI10_11770 [Pseudomonadota bacterium]
MAKKPTSSTSKAKASDKKQPAAKDEAKPVAAKPKPAAEKPKPAPKPAEAPASTTTASDANSAATPGTSSSDADGSSVVFSSSSNGSNGPGGTGHDNSSEGDPKMPTLKFIDAANAQERAEFYLAKTKTALEAKQAEGNLTPRENAQLELLNALSNADSKPSYAQEDLYITLRQELEAFVKNGVPPLNDGVFGPDQPTDIGDLSNDEKLTAMVWGRLARENLSAPRLLEAMGYDDGEFTVKGVSKNLSKALTDAVAIYNHHKELFTEVLDVMAFANDVNASGQLKASDWVSVTETLIKKGLDAESPGLATQIRAAIGDRLAPSNDTVTATQEILLPNLEAETAQEVQATNLEAAQAIYFAAMMDEARLFDSVDKLAELFQIGALPLEKGLAGEYLYRYIRATPDRISPFERRNTYARVFGAATGDPSAAGTIFRNFDELWIRFVSSVSDWYRKNQVENLFSTNGNFVPSQEQVRKTGLDLAANLSLYCYGGTWFVASELQKNITEYIDLLSSPEIKQLYGARDMWQVIDQIAVLEFGQPVNTVRARTKANAGAMIIGWLEKHAAKLSEPGTMLINRAEIASPRTSSTHSAINDPSDYDLVTACEQWLAIEGVGSDLVELNASASPSAVLSTAPVRVPPAAQEILGAFGFEHQGGAPNGALNGSQRLIN